MLDSCGSGREADAFRVYARPDSARADLGLTQSSVESRGAEVAFVGARLDDLDDLAWDAETHR